jgi:NAD(P)H-hydrate epimerase
MPSINGKMVYDETRLDGAIKGLKVLGVGVGWDQSADYVKILEYILTKYNGILVIDADGLNTLSKMDLSILNASKAKIILTPHLKEFSRLTGYDVSYINTNSIELVNDFVNKYNVTLLLKGSTTIVADKNDLYLIDKGSSGMATAGSGDVLTGILVGLLGYHNEDICYSVAVSSYINGYAGEKACEEYGSAGMVSSDTARMISYVLKEL